jgi:hypothetical protein
MDQTEPHFLSDPMSDRKKKVSPTLRNIYKKQHGARPAQSDFLVSFNLHPNKNRKKFYKYLLNRKQKSI